MDYEQAVLALITANRETFAAPQYAISKDTTAEWSCPDIVAIRPPKKICYVVEVSVAYNLTGLASKAKDRQKQWLNPLRTQLESFGIIDSTWRFQVLIFVRRERVAWLSKLLKGLNGVAILAIESVLQPWEWNEQRKRHYEFT